MRGRQRNAPWPRRPISRNGSVTTRSGRRCGGAANIRTRTTRRDPLLRAVLQILVGNREHRIRPDLDVAHDALPCIGIADLRVVAAGLDAGGARPLIMVDLLVLVIQGLVRTPVGLAGRRKLEAGNGLRRQIPEPDALALALRGGFAGKRQQRDQHQTPTHQIVLPRRRRYCLIRRSRFFALSKFLARSRPIGAISLAEVRSAPSKSVSMTVAPVRSAPPSWAFCSDAPVRSAPLGEANSRSTRDRSALRAFNRSRLADRSTARINPIDWLRMSAPRCASAIEAPTRLAPLRSAAMRAPVRSAPSR